ncbi:hypothetical protein Tsubulata_024823, partial [Turnera subulata]
MPLRVDREDLHVAIGDLGRAGGGGGGSGSGGVTGGEGEGRGGGRFGRRACGEKKPKMAEMILTFVVEDLLKKLASLALEKISLARGLKGKLQKLNNSMTFIRAVLHDAMERQAREESVKVWLQKLRDVAYEAEDVLDEFGYEVLRQEVEGSTP